MISGILGAFFFFMTLCETDESLSLSLDDDLNNQSDLYYKTVLTRFNSLDDYDMADLVRNVDNATIPKNFT